VFGAMAPVSRTYDVIADIDHPWEGTYELTVGQSPQGPPQDTLTLFVTRDAPAPVLIGALGARGSRFLDPRFEGTGSVAPDGSLVLQLVADPPGQPNRQRRYVLTASRFDPSGTTTGSFRNPDGVLVSGGFALRRLP
jgi:hypothetical protein